MSLGYKWARRVTGAYFSTPSEYNACLLSVMLLEFLKKSYTFGLYRFNGGCDNHQLVKTAVYNVFAEPE